MENIFLFKHIAAQLLKIRSISFDYKLPTHQVLFNWLQTTCIIKSFVYDLITMVREKERRRLRVKLWGCFGTCWLSQITSELPPKIILQNIFKYLGFKFCLKVRIRLFPTNYSCLINTCLRNVFHKFRIAKPKMRCRYLLHWMCRQVWADIQIVFQVDVAGFEDQ
jgi:hypothetical protein